jgi:hypothetical protein
MLVPDPNSKKSSMVITKLKRNENNMDTIYKAFMRACGNDSLDIAKQLYEILPEEKKPKDKTLQELCRQAVSADMFHWLCSFDKHYNPLYYGMFHDLADDPDPELYIDDK